MNLMKLGKETPGPRRARERTDWMFLLILLVASASILSCSREVPQPVFASPEEAGEALIAAAAEFDPDAMAEIFGPNGADLAITGDPVLDESQAGAFAAAAAELTRIDRDPENSAIAVLVVGAEEWPLPIPLIEDGGGWRFDTEAGREEILYRRIGSNELTAIEVCRGYVEAQHEYALEKHDDSRVHQYAQRIISSPGKQDGLAWQDPDGSWSGPVGEAVARVIAEGYVEQYKPYHGYYFKILTGQGPSAPLGEMDFVVEGAMIGGFALVAAPVDYEVTGVMTFLVSHEGVVYQKDLGEDTLELFRAMERYDPDSTWSPVVDPVSEVDE